MEKLSQISPDVVYQRHNVYMTSGLMAAKRLKIPVILEVNAPVFYEGELYLNFIFKRNEIKAFKLADMIIVVSDNVKHILMEVGIMEDKIHVMTNAVDAETFNPKVRGDHVRDKYGLNNKIVVY